MAAGRLSLGGGADGGCDRLGSAPSFGSTAPGAPAAPSVPILRNMIFHPAVHTPGMPSPRRHGPARRTQLACPRRKRCGPTVPTDPSSMEHSATRRAGPRELPLAIANFRRRHYRFQKGSTAFMRRRCSVVTSTVVVASDACPRFCCAISMRMPLEIAWLASRYLFTPTPPQRSQWMEMT